MRTLGLCGAFLNSKMPCDGELIVDREDDQWVEACCDKCGMLAAAPTGRAVVKEHEGSIEPWWNN